MTVGFCLSMNRRDWSSPCVMLSFHVDSAFTGSSWLVLSILQCSSGWTHGCAHTVYEPLEHGEGILGQHFSICNVHKNQLGIYYNTNSDFRSEGGDWDAASLTSSRWGCWSTGHTVHSKIFSMKNTQTLTQTDNGSNSTPPPRSPWPQKREIYPRSHDKLEWLRATNRALCSDLQTRVPQLQLKPLS